MKKTRILGLLSTAVLTAALLAACGNSDAASATTGNSATAAPTATPEPAYEANALTGEAKDANYPDGQRLTAVMVNNITVARPQRGLSDAQMLFEIKVEGGITRFMALYNDYNDITQIGPVRSARDQFFRLILPWQPIYVHDGQSIVQAQYIADYDYDEWNFNNGANGFRDTSRKNWQGMSPASGLATEHTEYTDAEHIQKYIDDNSVDMNKTYASTFFKFCDYRTNEVRTLDGDDAQYVSITHSQSYKTRFTFDDASTTYQMQQYYSTDGAWRDTIDENNQQQLAFTNVIVLFTDIHTYPGHEAKDLQYAEYSWGGVGYYFYGGKAEKIYWQKGTPLEALRLYYLTADGKCSDEMLDVNIGKSYVAVVDLDEYENGFRFSSLDGVDLTKKDAVSTETYVSADVSDSYTASKGSVAIDGDQAAAGLDDATAAPAETEAAAPAEQSAPEATEAPAEQPAPEAPAETPVETPAEEPATENAETPAA